MHDHTPHHGGVVGMAGEHHLEALSHADGRLQLWVTDFWRRAVPLDTVAGTVTVASGGVSRKAALVREEDALAATVAAPDPGAIDARFELEIGGEPKLIDFVLGIDGEGRGAAGVPSGGCRTVRDEERSPVPGTATPACVLPFGRGIGAIAASSERVLIAAVDVGVSEWAMPGASLLFGLEAPPPVVAHGPGALVPHPEVASALAMHPSGGEVVVALENRLLRYSTSDGKLRRELETAPGAVRSVVWSPDGSTLLVGVFYRPVALLVSATDGGVLRSLPVPREVSAVAFSASGELAAVSSEAGGITLFETASGKPVRSIDTGEEAMEALAIGRDTGRDVIFGGGRSGTLQAWDAATGSRITPSGGRRGRAILHIAVSPAGDRIAVGGYDGDLRLFGPAGELAEALPWHRGAVTGLAWAGDTLVSGDAQGTVAFWRLPRRTTSPTKTPPAPD